MKKPYDCSASCKSLTDKIATASLGASIKEHKSEHQRNWDTGKERCWPFVGVNFRGNELGV